MTKSVVSMAAAANAKKFAGKKTFRMQAAERPIAPDAAKENSSETEGQQAAEQLHLVVSDGGLPVISMAGDTPFGDALAAAAESASLTAEVSAQDSGDGGSDGGGEGTILLIGAVGLVGAGVAVLASGGGSKNQAPTIANPTQAVTTAEDTAKAITVSATDPDGDPLTYTVTTTSKNGTVSGGAGGAFTYTPNADFNGTDSFVVTAKDPDGLTVAQTVNVTVTAVNDAPRPNKATTTALTINEDTPTEVVIDFTDPEGNTPLVLAVTKAPANGTFANVGGKNIYTPNANYAGPDSVTYTVTDSQGAAATQTVAITVNAVNDAPTVANPIPDQGATEAAAFTYQVPANTFVDVDNASLTFTASLTGGGALPAWLTFNAATRTFSGTPPQETAGTLSIVVTASDGTLSVTDTFVLTVANDITTVSLDVVGPNSTTPATISAAADTILFTDNAAANTDVFLTGFSANDQIRVTGATAAQYNFGTSATDANDLLITFNSGGNFTIITIDEILPDNAFVSDFASANQAVGFAFMTFA